MPPSFLPRPPPRRPGCRAPDTDVGRCPRNVYETSRFARRRRPGTLILEASGRLPAPAPSEEPMIARQQQPHFSGRRAARRGAPPSDVARADTIPRAPLLSVGAADEPTILGFPAEEPDDGDPDADVPGDDGAEERGTYGERRSTVVTVRPEGLDSPGRLVVLRYADTAGGLCLVLAGAVAAVSLWLPWMRGPGGTGLLLFRQGVDSFGSGVAGLARGSIWPPLAVVL